MIETKNLTKTFDNFTAVDSLDLKIETGEFSVFLDRMVPERLRRSVFFLRFFFRLKEKS